MSPSPTDERLASRPFLVADWHIDPTSNRLSRGSTVVRLEPRVMSVLVYLARHAGDVVRREELERAVWAGLVVGYDALGNAIIKLRKALGDQARSPRYIETVPKTGYRLIAAVSGESSSLDTELDARLPRRLAAILYADVAGYSRLTGADEDATHRALSESLDQISGTVGGHRGRIAHYAGDAVLAVFGAALDAVACAIEIQDALAVRNADRPVDRRVEFRIGINLGDVIEDRGDVYGDGVNVAARLEQLADAGGIAVSDAVRTAIGNKLSVAFRFTGEHQVKNITEPVRAYRVGPRTGLGDPMPFDRPEPELPDRPSIAVLAFDNMSGDPEQAYFSDGVAEDVITDLSKIAGLFVIARNSSFAYRGQQVDMRALSRELGVRYVLEGSVRRAGQRLRITAQLIDGTTGGHVWAERYDRDVTDIFAVQDEVRRAIVEALQPTLTAGERRRFDRHHTENREAHDYFMRGREEDQRDNREANIVARGFLASALECDPQFSLACSHLSRNHAVGSINRWAPGSEVSLHSARLLAERSIELDADSPHAHFALGATALWQRAHDLARREAELAVTTDPNFADGHAVLAMILVYASEARVALSSIETAMRLDPRYRDIYLHIAAQAYFHSGQLEAAADALQRRLIRKPDSDASRALLASTFGHLGRLEDSRAEWEEMLRGNPRYSLRHRREVLPYKHEADFEQFAAGLHIAGIV